MTILHLNLQDGWRGGEQQLAYLLVNHQQRGINSILVCKPDSDLHHFALANNIPCFPVKNNGINKFSAILNVKKLIKRKNIELIHCHESKGLNIAIAIKALFRVKKPLILHRRVVFPIKGWFSRNIKYSDKYIDQTICISTAVQRVFNQTTKNNKTLVIPSMTDISFDYTNTFILKDEYQINTSKVIIGYIAALTYEKDHETFLKTAKKILTQREDILFLIIGKGPLEASLKQLSKKLNIENNVKFLGFVPNAKKLIPEIDILLFTSRFEGFGSTILDFFIAKKPVIAVKNGGSEDAITNESTGYLCEAGDVEKLTEYTLEVLNNPKKTNILVNNAYNYTVKNCSINAVSQLILDTYKQCLK